MLHSTPHHLIIYALVKELLHALGGGERKESVAKAGYTAMRMMAPCDVVYCCTFYKTNDCILLELELESDVFSIQRECVKFEANLPSES